MKRKLKKAIKKFFEPTDKQESFNYDNLFDLVERLQYRIEDMENEHMQLIVRFAHLESKFDNHEHGGG